MGKDLSKELVGVIGDFFDRHDASLTEGLTALSVATAIIIRGTSDYLGTANDETRDVFIKAFNTAYSLFPDEAKEQDGKE